MKFILGKKLSMTQVFKEDGTIIPVTAVLAEPNVITQIKTVATDKYDGVQIGWGAAKKLKKAQAGHLKDLAKVKVMREFAAAAEEISGLKRGDEVTVEAFQAGDKVKVTGQSKGRGFQGVVKRHGFHGSPKTHGHKDQNRMPGSIGAGGVQRVFKGIRMAGRMGAEQVTISGLEIVEVDPSKNVLYIKGAVPGARNGLLLISGEGKLEVKQPQVEQPAVAEKIEEVVATATEPTVEAVAEPAPVVAEEKPSEENKIDS